MAQDKLSDYGKSFQEKTIAGLLTDKKFLDQVSDLLSPDYFDSDPSKWIVSSITTYYDEYRTFPPISVFKVLLSRVQNDVLKATILDKLKSIYKYRKANEMPFVKHEFLEFCKNQKIKSAIISSVDLLKMGDYDNIKKLFDEALRAGIDRDEGLDYLEDFEARMLEVARDTISTGWSVIDDIMDGGLAPGELGVVVAPAGIGKSWALQCIAANALRAGKTVNFYTLELAERYTGFRFDSIYTGMSSHDLKDNVDLIRENIKGLTGTLKIKYYPTKSITVNTISAHIERQSVTNPPDLVVVDYADLLRSIDRAGDVRHLELGGIYEELRGMAGSLGLPIWTASQANRGSLEEEVIQAQSVAESYNKVMIADFIISLSRHMDDKLSNKGRWHVIKNRFGPDGLTFQSNIDTSIGKIEIFDANSASNQYVIPKNTSDDMIRKLTGKRFNELTDMG